MIRKITLAVASGALAIGGVAAMATPAFAGKPALGNASGVVSCNITGKVKISPPLTNANTQPSTTTAKTKSTSCSGTPTGAPGTIAKSKGAVISVGTSPGTCNGLLAPGTTPFNVDISWKGNGFSLNPSHITFQNVAPSGDGFDLPSGGFANRGTSVVTGSFAGETAWSHASVDNGPIIAALTTPGGCNPNSKGKAKGIKKITITGGHIDIGS